MKNKDYYSLNVSKHLPVGKIFVLRDLCWALNFHKKWPCVRYPKKLIEDWRKQGSFNDDWLRKIVCEEPEKYFGKFQVDFHKRNFNFKRYCYC